MAPVPFLYVFFTQKLVALSTVLISKKNLIMNPILYCPYALPITLTRRAFFVNHVWSGSYYFLSAAQPTDQGEESVVLLVGFVVVVVVGFGGTVFISPMYTQKGCIQRKFSFKRGVSRENFSSKGVQSEKFFLQKGCIQRNLFFKRGEFREKFSSKWVLQDKTLAFLWM